MASGPSPATVNPPWFLAAVRIQDFRSIEHAYIRLDKTTVLLGANNTGKTSVLQAIMYAIAGGSPTTDDLRKSTKGVFAKEFVVDLRFEPWPGEADFPQVVKDRYTAAPGLLESPPFIGVRIVGRPASDGTRLDLDRALLDGWSDDRSAAAALPTLNDKPVTRLMWTMVNAEFLGPSRDLDEQTGRRRSHLGQALADLRIPEQDAKALLADIEKLAGRITRSSPALSSVENDIARIGQEIDEAIQKTQVSVLPPDVNDLGQNLDVRISSHGGPLMPLRMQGHGARSLAAIAVAQALAGHRLSGGPNSTLPITCLEEPEAHLHPQAHDAARTFIDALPGQSLVTTHSPYIARGSNMRDLRVLRSSRGATRIVAVPDVDHTGSPPFSRDQEDQANRFLRRHAGEALFARCVLLIEGSTEAGAVPVFAEDFFGREPASMGLTIHSIDGAPAWPHFVKPLHYLDVPWFLLLDGDGAGQTERQKLHNALPPHVHHRLKLLPHGEDFEAMMVRCNAQVCSTFATMQLGARSLGNPPKAASTVKALRKAKRIGNGRDLAQAMTSAGSIPQPLRDLFVEIRKLLNT